MNRDQGIKRLKEVLASLPEDISLWPRLAVKINECGCILQQAAGDGCIDSEGQFKYLTVIRLSKILGLRLNEGDQITYAYDSRNKQLLTCLIGELT